jgi:hypothetical protein
MAKILVVEYDAAFMRMRCCKLLPENGHEGSMRQAMARKPLPSYSEVKPGRLSCLDITHAGNGRVLPLLKKTAWKWKFSRIEPWVTAMRAAIYVYASAEIRAQKTFVDKTL